MVPSGIAQDVARWTARYSYGGDFDDHPNLGAFWCESYRLPKYWEVKKVYQPVAIEPSQAKLITNRNWFLIWYEAGWSVTDDGGDWIWVRFTARPGKKWK